MKDQDARTENEAPQSPGNNHASQKGAAQPDAAKNSATQQDAAGAGAEKDGAGTATGGAGTATGGAGTATGGAGTATGGAGRQSDRAEAVFKELAAVGGEVDRTEVIADGVKVLAGWCLRLLIIAATSFVVFYLVSKFWGGLLPIILAIIVCTVLWGPNVALRNLGLHRALAALLTILGSFGAFGALIWVVAPDVARQSQTLYFQAFEGIQQLQIWAQGPPLNLDSDELAGQLNRAVQWVQERSGMIAGEIFSGIGAATSAIVTLGIVLVLTFFFLKDGDNFLPWVRSIVGRRAGWHLTEWLTRSWNTLGGFIRAQAIVSLVDAFFIGLGLVILGVPMALALAVLTFIAGFIPIVGAFVAGTLAVLVALVSLGFTEAIITLIIILAVQQLEGNILSPMLQSKAMNLHPVVVLISVTLGGSLFNIIGAFLAVPFAAMVAVLLRYLQDVTALRAGEKTAEDIEFATFAGSISGKYSEKEGQKRAARIQLNNQAQLKDRFFEASDKFTSLFNRH